MSNLQTRILSALVLAAVALAATWAGGVWFALLAAAAAAAIYFEWASLAADVASRAFRSAGAVLVAVPVLLMVFGYPAAHVFGAAAAATLFAFVYALAAEEGGRVWLAVGYASVPTAAAAFLRGSDMAGLEAILFLFAVVWATDIFAYFVGRAVGGRKLAPSISPGKTLSGAVGGAAAAVVAGVLVAAIFGARLGLIDIGLLALGLSVVSQAGDLFESSVKRRFGVKDSGKLIPGHGGVMDRLDALVAAAAALYLVGAALGSPDMPSASLFGG